MPINNIKTTKEFISKEDLEHLEKVKPYLQSTCFVCKRILGDTPIVCSGCKIMQYCSVECQHGDQVEHSLACEKREVNACLKLSSRIAMKIELAKSILENPQLFCRLY